MYNVYSSSTDVLATVSGMREVECAVHCQNNPYCVSFNIRQNGDCQILGEWKNDANIITEQGAIFAGSMRWIVKLILDCTLGRQFF